jgi:hypothetical protein
MRTVPAARGKASRSARYVERGIVGSPSQGQVMRIIQGMGAVWKTGGTS